MKSLSKIVILQLFLTACFFSPDKSAARKPPTKSKLNCIITPQIMRVFLSQHMVQKKLSSEIRKRTVKSFIESMDGMKILFTKEDYKKLDKELNNMFVTMGRGDCKAIEEVRKTAEIRSKENYAHMTKLLGNGFKFDEGIELVTNPEKREYPDSKQDAYKFLDKYVHLQIARYLAADKKLDEAKKLTLKSYNRALKKLRELESPEVLGAFLNSFSSSLDPHSNYFSPKSDEEFEIDMTNSLEGIGASLGWEDGFTVVHEVIAGGPAERAKNLIRKDKILAVAQGASGQFVPIIDMELSDVVRLIRGKKGTTVRLRILRKVDGNNSNVEIAIVRDKVSIKDQMARVSYEKKKHGDKEYNLAVISLPSFYTGERGAGQSAYEDVRKLLEQAKKKKIDGVVLNLTNNAGGSLPDAVNLAGLFIGEGGVTASKFVDGKVNVLADDDSGIVYSGPLVVLTSRFSASASEIVAGALQDYKRAVIVGADHTFGKGTIQQLSPLSPELGAIKYTISMYYLPGGHSPQHSGVDSDVVLPSVLHTDDYGEKSFDYSLPPSKVKSFVSAKANLAEGAEGYWTPVKASVLKDVANNSTKRVKSKEDFKDIFKDIEEVKNKDEVVKVKEFLVRAKESEEKDEKNQDKKQIELIEEAGRPYVNEALDILVDLIAAT